MDMLSELDPTMAVQMQAVMGLVSELDPNMAEQMGFMGIEPGRQFETSFIRTMSEQMGAQLAPPKAEVPPSPQSQAGSSSSTAELTRSRPWARQTDVTSGPDSGDDWVTAMDGAEYRALDEAGYRALVGRLTAMGEAVLGPLADEDHDSAHEDLSALD